MDNALSKNTENNAKPMSDEEKFELSDRINHLQGNYYCNFNTSSYVTMFCM